MCWAAIYPGQYNPLIDPNPVRLENFEQTDYSPDYQRIQNFLLNESEVKIALLSLQDDVLEVGVQTPEAFEEFLEALELSLEFEPAVCVEGILSPQTFLSYVRSKKPIDDQGVSHAHGRSTHRVQWILIARNVQLNRRVAGVYASIADAKAREAEWVGPVEPTLWDSLFDREDDVHNATCPEFFHHKWLKTQGDLERLRDVWR